MFGAQAEGEDVQRRVAWEIGIGGGEGSGLVYRQLERCMEAEKDLSDRAVPERKLSIVLGESHQRARSEPWKWTRQCLSPLRMAGMGSGGPTRLRTTMELPGAVHQHIVAVSGVKQGAWLNGTGAKQRDQQGRVERWSHGDLKGWNKYECLRHESKGWTADMFKHGRYACTGYSPNLPFV